MASKDDLRSMTGPQKAAVLMLTLGEEHSSKLFSMMDDEEIKEISQTMASLGTISSNLIESLFADFAQMFSRTGSVTGSFESTERLLIKSLPKDRVSQIMEEIRGPAGRTMWDKLGNVNEGVLANYLKNEYPQTVAVVLSKIEAGHASRVLGELPEEFAMECIMRMLHMEAVQKDVLDSIQATLREEFMAKSARQSKRDTHEAMAEIFNSFDRATESRFMTALEERSKDAAEKIKSLMFTFDDLAKIDPAGIQTVLRSVEKDRLSLALKGGSETVRDLFFKNMSERAAKIMREDMESMGPVRVKDVDEAQTEVVRVAKELAQRGEIFIASGKGGDDGMIY